MKQFRLLVLAALVAAFSFPAMAQVAGVGDLDHSFGTPGNATIPGVMQMTLQPGTNLAVPSSVTNPTFVTITPSGSGSTAINAVVSGSAEACHVLKGSSGILYSVYAVNLTATPGFLVVLNATSAPVDGAITPIDFAPLPANGSAQINFGSGPPNNYNVGITACLSSNASVFTKTTGVITGAISGRVK